MNTLKQIFKFVNRYFMVPAYRMGLGWLIVNPISGYIMVIKNIGRKSGKLYYTPTNYAIFEGKIYCLAGFGRKAHWYLNMIANPHVELLLPGRAIWGEVEEVIDQDEALKAVKQVFKNAGFAGFAEGYNPRTAPEEKFLRHAGARPGTADHSDGNRQRSNGRRRLALGRMGDPDCHRVHLAGGNLIFLYVWD